MLGDGASTRPLGRSGVRVGSMSFGAAVIGNLYAATDPDTATGAVHAALRGGVRYFDTAPHYGLGLSEQRLGAALREVPRAQVLISTKVGRLLVPDPAGARQQDVEFEVPAAYRRVRDYSRDGVLRSLEESLRRLDTDRIDVVFVHDPDEHYAQAMAGAFPALAELRAQGVIASYGAGMNSPGMLADFVANTDSDVVMLAGRFTLLNQAALTELLPRCLERGVSLVAAGVFNSGILAVDRPRTGATYGYQPASAPILARANRIADICESYGVRLPQAAVQFPLCHPSVATVCLGARTAEEVTRNATLFAEPVPLDCWRELAEEGLLPTGLPNRDEPTR